MKCAYVYLTTASSIVFLFFFCQFVNIKRRDHLLKKMVGVFPFLYRRKSTEAHGVSRVYFILYM